MTDSKQVRQLAEQLAKAQFAAKRDPHACALMYIALGKKTLLQVRHPLLLNRSALLRYLTRTCRFAIFYQLNIVPCLLWLLEDCRLPIQSHPGVQESPFCPTMLL